MGGELEWSLPNYILDLSDDDESDDTNDYDKKDLGLWLLGEIGYDFRYF